MKLALLCAALISTFSINSIAGGRAVGNGGGAWICVDPTNANKVIKTELADFAETYYSENTTFDLSHALKIEHIYNVPLAEELDKIALRLISVSFKLYTALRPLVAQMQANTVFVNRSMNFSSDANVMHPLKDWCPHGLTYYQQVATYLPNDLLQVSWSWWSYPLTSSTSKAGLIYHEAIYKYLRDFYADTNSDRTRQITAYLFAQDLSLHDLKNKLNSTGIEL